MASASINLRAPFAQKTLIDQAAQLEGKSRTDFMLEAACEKAQQVLLDHTIFMLDSEHHQRFMTLLDAPLNDEDDLLKRLLEKTAPWEH